MLIADAVHIWREEDGDYHVEWRSSRPDTEVIIEAVAGAPAVGGSGETGRVRLSGLAPANRHQFRLRDQHGTEVLAGERRLSMAGTPNFRDFGGYTTADGRRVRWGCLYRSGQLSALTDSDVALLATLGLDLVCDFRRLEEQESDPSRLPAENPPVIASLPIVPGSNSRFFEEAEGHPGDRQAMFDFMVEINRDFADDQRETYGRMFREILDRDDARFLVHCAAGKDRTGFAAAIILMALGVPREVVMADYLLTARFFHPRREVDRLKRKYEMEHMDTDAVVPMLEVHEAYLARALAAIDDSHGSVETYLEDALGVGAAEQAELRRRYLD